VVWVESCENVYTRLTDMLAWPQRDAPILAWWLAQQPRWFRAAAAAAAAADPVSRRQALETLRARGRHVEVNA
jgi:hypothetical protein